MNKYRTVFNFRQDLPVWSIYGVGLNIHTLIFIGIAFGIYVIQFLIFLLFKVNVFISLVLPLPMAIYIFAVGHWPVKKYQTTLDRVILMKILYKLQQRDFVYRRR